MSKICVHCGKILNNDLNYCSECGEKIVEFQMEKEFKCKKCGYKLSPTFNFCPKCGMPFGRAEFLISQGQSFKEYTDYKLIREAAQELIEKTYECAVGLEQCAVVGKTYMENSGIREKIQIYHVIAKTTEREHKEEKYGILLWNPQRFGENITYHFLSSAVKCSAMEDSEVKEMLLEFIKNEYEYIA